MPSYLNLDLLYNIDTYLYPLFYYKCSDRSEVYSPMTLKSIANFNHDTFYFDHITINYHYICTFTEEYTINNGHKYSSRCEPFKLSKEQILFLKSNKRLNLCI